MILSRKQRQVVKQIATVFFAGIARKTSNMRFFFQRFACREKLLPICDANVAYCVLLAKTAAKRVFCVVCVLYFCFSY